LKHRGFTLIEVLVTLVLVSTVSLLAWRGLDGINQSTRLIAAHDEYVTRIDVALAQWTADLDAIPDRGALPLLMTYDGKTLTLLRSVIEPKNNLMVVAWTIRDGQLLRYASQPIQTKLSLQAALSSAQRWSQTPLPEDAPLVVRLVNVEGWNLYFFREDSWSNPQSSISGQEGVPQGVRLELNLTPNLGFSGKIVRDWSSPVL
jgi:general secretion pathway protein J